MTEISNTPMSGVEGFGRMYVCKHIETPVSVDAHPANRKTSTVSVPGQFQEIGYPEAVGCRDIHT